MHHRRHIDALDPGVPAVWDSAGCFEVLGDFVAPFAVFRVLGEAPHVENAFDYFRAEIVVVAVTDWFEAWYR